jgi:outer membrane protein OmpA-like peptidoglycan-associated protein
VVKLDLTTVPENTELEITSNRNAGYGGTVFADVYPGDIFKVNFALAPLKVRVKSKGVFTPLEGRVSFKRLIEEVLTDPSTGKVSVKNSLVVENATPYPLYEVVYSESSPYRPKEGSSYLNGSPYDDPVYEGESFSWRIPLIPPKERATLTWFSPLPSKGERAKGELQFALKPVEGQSLEIPVKVPVVFEAVKPDVYRLTVYFDFGSYELTPEAKASLEKIANFLRKRNYKTVFVKIVGHTDSVKVKKDAKDYRSNRELSLKRAKAVRDCLKELLIDLRKVKIER